MDQLHTRDLNLEPPPPCPECSQSKTKRQPHPLRPNAHYFERFGCGHALPIPKTSHTS